MVAVYEIGIENLSTPQYPFCLDASKQVFAQPNKCYGRNA